MTNEADFEFDPVKGAKNLAKHGVSFSEVVDFDWENADVEEDFRNIYMERRFRATGLLHDRLHILVYCVRGALKRIISLRKANVRESKKYANSN